MPNTQGVEKDKTQVTVPAPRVQRASESHELNALYSLLENRYSQQVCMQRTQSSHTGLTHIDPSVDGNDGTSFSTGILHEFGQGDRGGTGSIMAHQYGPEILCNG